MVIQNYSSSQATALVAGRRKDCFQGFTSYVFIRHLIIRLLISEICMLDIYIPARNLRSSTSSNCLVKVTTSDLKSYSDITFSVAAPKLWNQLPLNIRLSSSVVSIKSSLKTLLLNQSLINAIYCRVFSLC